MNERLQKIILEVEFVRTAFNSNEPTELYRIFVEKQNDDLRRRANLETSIILNCNLITSIYAAEEALQAYSKINKEHFCWALTAELYKTNV